jgi:hypothetical protein
VVAHRCSGRAILLCLPSFDPEKRRAQRLVQGAVRRGELVRPERCEHCDAVPPRDRDGRLGIVADHADYSRPLDVQWLCRGCHAEIHLERGDAVPRREPDGTIVWHHG